MRTGAYRLKIVWWIIGLAAGFVGIGFGLTTVYPLRYEQAITAAAVEHKLDPYLVFGVIRAESRFRPRVVSRAGAIGLMQITPTTGQWIAGKLNRTGFAPTDLYDPQVNLQFGTWYLRYLIDRFGGDLNSALLAYNAGPGSVERWGGDNTSIYPASTRYLAAVRRNSRIYRLLYGSFLGPVLRTFTS